MQQWEALLAKAREEDKVNATAWVQHNTQPCPNCGAPIQRNGGCNHISCTVCRHHFCWVCCAVLCCAVLCCVILHCLEGFLPCMCSLCSCHVPSRHTLQAGSIPASKHVLHMLRCARCCDDQGFHSRYSLCRLGVCLMPVLVPLPVWSLQSCKTRRGLGKCCYELTFLLRAL